MIFLNEQLQWSYFLQEWRSPLMDLIFRCLNCFDTDYFICSLVAFIWIGFSWRWGARLGLLMIASGWVNALVKLAFGLPRPFFFDPQLAIVKLHDYGFPSGGAQNAMILGCLLMFFWKNRWSRLLGCIYIVLISFSRIFLGVHFPMDVLGGWCIGAILFLLFIKSYRPIERFVSRHSEASVCISVVFSMVVLMILRDFKTIFLMASLMTTVIGIYFSTKYSLYIDPPPTQIRKKIMLGFFGIFTAFCIAILVRACSLAPLSSIIVQVVVSGLWISMLASPICKRIFQIQ